jgi:hypothetical protein
MPLYFLVNLRPRQLGGGVDCRGAGHIDPTNATAAVRAWVVVGRRTRRRFVEDSSAVGISAADSRDAHRRIVPGPCAVSIDLVLPVALRLTRGVRWPDSTTFRPPSGARRVSRRRLPRAFTLGGELHA